MNRYNSYQKAYKDILILLGFSFIYFYFPSHGFADTGIKVFPMIQTVTVSSSSPEASLSVSNTGTSTIHLTLQIVPIQQSKDGSAIMNSASNSLDPFYQNVTLLIDDKNTNTLSLDPQEKKTVILKVPSPIDKDYYLSLLMISKDVIVPSLSANTNATIYQQVGLSPYVFLAPSSGSRSLPATIHLQTPDTVWTNKLDAGMHMQNSNNTLIELHQKVIVSNTFGQNVVSMYLPIRYLFANSSRDLTMNISLPLSAVGKDDFRLITYDKHLKKWTSVTKSIIYIPLYLLIALFFFFAFITILVKSVKKELKKRDIE